MAKKKQAFVRVTEAQNKMYELMFILKPDMLESAVTKKLKDFKTYLEENNSKVILEDVWGKKRLAYRIKQYEEGIYVVYNIEAPTTFMKELDNHLRIDNQTIRHMVITLDKGYTYSKFDEEVEEEAEKPKKRVRKEESKEMASEKDAESAKKKPVEKKVEKEETKEPNKGELNEKLDKLLDGDDLNI